MIFDLIEKLADKIEAAGKHPSDYAIILSGEDKVRLLKDDSFCRAMSDVSPAVLGIGPRGFHYLFSARLPQTILVSYETAEINIELLATGQVDEYTSLLSSVC